MPDQEPPSSDIAVVNQRFYDTFWRGSRLQRPDRFNTWPLVSELVKSAPARLEIGPGLRPRLPIAGTHFIDISPRVIEQLGTQGGLATTGGIGALPFGDQTFDLVCACDVIEHAADDRPAFCEISRVLKDDGVLILSVPLHAAMWTAFDDWVGHARRYDPPALLAILAGHQLAIEQSAAYGMQPANPRWTNLGMWWMEHHRERAMFWYNWVGMPLAMLFQKRLTLERGLIDTTGVDEIVVVCRREVRVPPA